MKRLIGLTALGLLLAGLKQHSALVLIGLDAAHVALRAGWPAAGAAAAARARICVETVLNALAVRRERANALLLRR